MRKSAEIVIGDEGGRDRGKKYQITEMPARQAEMWAVRAFLALSRSGVEVPQDVADSGIAGLATFGLKGLSALRFEDAKPLLDEMMDCVQFKPDPRAPNIVRALIDDDIEEVATRLKLRTEVFKLHTGFSATGASSTQLSTMPAPGFLNTQIFPGR